MRISSPITTLFITINLITAVAFALLAVTAWYRGPKSPYLRVWAAFVAVGAIFSASVAAAGLVPTSAGLFVVRLGMSLGCIASFLFLRFALLFTNVRLIRPLTVVGGLWLSALIVLFWGTRQLLAGVTVSEFSSSAPVAGPLMPLYAAYLLFTWVVPLALFVRTLRRARGLRRTQTSYILVACAIGFVAAIGSLLPSLTGSQSLIAILPSLLYPLFPITITYAMVRYRLWDVRTIVHRTLIWALLSAVLVLPLYLALHWGSALYSVLRPGEFSVVLVGLSLAFYGYFRLFKPKLDHIFQRRAYDSRETLDSVARQLVGLGNPAEVLAHVEDTLDATVYPDFCSGAFCDRDGKRWRTVSAGPVDGAQLEELLPHGRWLAQAFGLHGASIERGEMEIDPRFEDVRSDGVRFFEVTGAQVCIPLVQGAELIGLLALGSKRSLRPYTKADLEFFDRLGAESSKALANAMLFHEVDRQRDELAKLATTLEQRVAARTAELAEANQSLQELDRYRSRFFANITHELRTPLTMMIAPLESLLGGELGPLAEKQSNYLKTISRNGLRLLKLINNLLDLAMLEERHLRIKVREHNLLELLDEIVEHARPLARRKDIQLDVSAPPAPVGVFIDTERIEQVVINLLSNALKFTNAGGKVSLVVREGAQQVEIAVTDTGIGIEADKLEKIFERFAQADASVGERYGGTGIGLAFAREIIKLHGGDIDVTSTVGEGTTFTVSLHRGDAHLDPKVIDRRSSNGDAPTRERRAGMREPREWARQLADRADYRFLDIDEATERRLVERTKAPPKASRVLVVEDNPEILKYVHLQLQDIHEVYLAQDGATGLEMAQRDHPDVIITDYMMPEMDGVQMIKRLREDKRTRDIPVIMLTAKNRVDDRMEARDAGADIYLSKPFSTRELRASIQQLLIKRGNQADSVAAAQLQTMEIISAGLAHEINNALSYLRSAVFVIGEKANTIAEAASDDQLDPQKRAHKISKARDRIARMNVTAERGLNRVAQIVELVRRYAREGYPREPDEVVFDDLARDVLELMAPRGGGNAQLQSELGAEHTKVRAIPEELGQVIRNLTQNALDVAASEVVVRSRADDQELVFEVEDDGPGIAPEHRDRIFAPFFTTKQPGQGMGLGLAISHQIVTGAGGKIRVTGRDAGGTRFVVTLPIAA